MSDSSKTFHRWTKDEDERLLKAVEDDSAAYASIGQPGGVARDLFWGQIPGRIGVLATPLACQMRHRTLTSDTEWARKRRKDGPKRKEKDSVGDLVKELASIKALLRKVLEKQQSATA
jgi:hypothetical protein